MAGPEVRSGDFGGAAVDGVRCVEGGEDGQELTGNRSECARAAARGFGPCLLGARGAMFGIDSAATCGLQESGEGKACFGRVSHTLAGRITSTLDGTAYEPGSRPGLVAGRT